MTATPIARTRIATLADLDVGDQVVLTRGDRTSRPSSIIDRREVPAVAGWGGRKARVLVRVASGSWYDLTDGSEHHDGDSHIDLAGSR